MKRYIKCEIEVDIDTSLFEGTPITPHTGMSYYDEFLNEEELDYKRKAKNRDGRIVMMTPDMYFWECSHHGFNYYVSENELRRQRRVDSERLEELRDMLESGKKFWLPVLNYADHSQEGLHRMMVLGDLYGWTKKEYPVLVVTPYDQEKENRWKLQEEAGRFLDSNFEKACKWAISKFRGYNKPVPNNLTELLNTQVTEEVKNMWNIDIEVESEIKEVEGHPQLQIYLTKYKTYEFDMLTGPYTAWLEDLFDVHGEYSKPTYPVNQELSDMLLDDSDLFI